MIEFDYLDFLSGLEIKKGDIIDVVSDLRSIMLYAREKKLRFSPDELIDALMELVGGDGTVMIRVFNWDFCHGIPFDIRTSPSQVGALGNLALKRSEFIRTKHPIYSWMVWGNYADHLSSMENVMSFGPSSPWEFMYEKNAILLSLGDTRVNGFTHAHYIEQKLSLPFRFEKTFSGKYIDNDGNVYMKDYSMYVRYLDYDIYTDIFPEVQDELADMGIIKRKAYGTLPLWSARLKETMDFVEDDLKNNLGKKTCIVNQEKGYGYALEHPPKLDDPATTQDPDDKYYY